MKICVKCKKEYKNTGPAQRFCAACKPSKKAPKKKEVVAIIEEPIPTCPQFLTIDLSNYPKLYPRLMDEAVKEFRTPELQTIFYLDMMLSEPEKKKLKKKDPLDEL